jgi:hypothetical protein
MSANSLQDESHELLEVQRRLEKAGVVDVKFYFQPDLQKRPFSEVKSSIATILRAHLDGQIQESGLIGDDRP